MKDLSAYIQEFLQEVELSSGKKFAFPGEVTTLFDIAMKAKKQRPFSELLFHAAAASKTQEVMKRIGPGTDGYEKLATEFQSNAQQVTRLVREIIQTSAQEEQFEKLFLVFETESFLRLTQLCSDLRLIKSWEIDGKPLPTLETLAVHRSKKIEKIAIDLHLLYQRAKRSVILACVLLIVLSLLDPPATILGWCITITVLGLLAYIYFLIVEFNERVSENK